jgi:hypothetical protein
MLESKSQLDNTTLPELPGVIRDAVNTDNLVVFIGAGVSALVGCMRWPVLAKRLAEECHKRGCIDYSAKDQLKNDNDHLKVISVAYELLRADGKKEHFDRELGKALRPKKKDNFPDIYSRLWGFGGAFITTNADQCFHSNFLNENIFIEPKQFEREGIRRRRLYHIHGCIKKPTSLVFRKSEYLERYSAENRAFRTFIMEQVFAPEKVILFVGYGLREFELLSLLISPGGEKQEYKRFALMPYYRRNSHLLKFDRIYFRNFGINIKEYYLDDRGYDELYEVIEKWSDEIAETTMLAHEDHQLIDEAVK